METLTFSLDNTIVLQLVISLLLGALIGLERSIAGKTAGMRTFALVSVGATLFMIIGMEIVSLYADIRLLDPIRVVSAVVTGIGFLGAGLMIFSEKKVQGLTTAAGLWVSAAVGVAVGVGLYFVAIFTAFLTLFTLTVLWHVEDKAKESVEDLK